jgi:hypothetical protein
MTLAVLSAITLTDKHDSIIRRKLPIATALVYTTTAFCRICHAGTMQKPHSEIVIAIAMSKNIFKISYFFSTCGSWVNSWNYKKL